MRNVMPVFSKERMLSIFLVISVLVCLLPAQASEEDSDLDAGQVFNVFDVQQHDADSFDITSEHGEQNGQNNTDDDWVPDGMDAPNGPGAPSESNNQVGQECFASKDDTSLHTVPSGNLELSASQTIEHATETDFVDSIDINPLGQEPEERLVSFTGSVIDAETGDGLPGVLISTFVEDGFSIVCTTDSQGFWAIDGLSGNRAYSFTVSKEGYSFSPSTIDEVNAVETAESIGCIAVLGTRITVQSTDDQTFDPEDLVEKVEDESDEKTVVIAAFDPLDERTCRKEYDYGELASQNELLLPYTLHGEDEEGNAIALEGVEWQSVPTFDLQISGLYEFTPIVPTGYALAENALLPAISVSIRSVGEPQNVAMAFVAEQDVTSMYDATIDPGQGVITVNYGFTYTPTTTQFTIRNTGAGTITNLTAALETGNAFQIKSYQRTLAPGQSIAIPVTLIEEWRTLPAGTHTDVLTITCDNDISLSADLFYEAFHQSDFLYAYQTDAYQVSGEPQTIKVGILHIGSDLQMQSPNSDWLRIEKNSSSDWYIYADANYTGAPRTGKVSWRRVALAWDPPPWIDICIYQEPYYSVEEITDVPMYALVDIPLTLAGTVVPPNAMNQTIAWRIVDAGTTGATISGDVFMATSIGTAEIRGTIIDGQEIGNDYEQLFDIVVNPVEGIGTDITGRFVDPNFLKAVREVIGKPEPEPILDIDVSGITALYVSSKKIRNMAGLDCFVSLEVLYCDDNDLLSLDISGLALTELNCSLNYLANKNSVIGFSGDWDGRKNKFYPQKSWDVESPTATPHPIVDPSATLPPQGPPIPANPSRDGFERVEAEEFFEGAPIEITSEIMRTLDHASDMYYDLFVKTMEKYSIGSWDYKGTSHYNPKFTWAWAANLQDGKDYDQWWRLNNRDIWYHFDKELTFEDKIALVFHEIGHAVDNVIGASIYGRNVSNAVGLLDAMRSDMKAMLVSAKNEVIARNKYYTSGEEFTLEGVNVDAVIAFVMRDDIGRDLTRSESYLADELLYYVVRGCLLDESVKDEYDKYRYIKESSRSIDEKNKVLYDDRTIVGGLSDILSGMTMQSDKVSLPWGHTSDYWQSGDSSSNKLERELWAHFFAAEITGNTEALMRLEKAFPTAYTVLSDMANRMYAHLHPFPGGGGGGAGGGEMGGR